MATDRARIIDIVGVFAGADGRGVWWAAQNLINPTVYARPTAGAFPLPSGGIATIPLAGTSTTCYLYDL